MWVFCPKICISLALKASATARKASCQWGRGDMGEGGRNLSMALTNKSGNLPVPSPPAPPVSSEGPRILQLALCSGHGALCHSAGWLF